MEVWQRGSSWVRRCAAIIGRKSPLFDPSRQIYTKNFGQGLHSGCQQEVPGGRDPQILVVPLQKLPHSGEILSLLLLHDQLPGITSEGQVLYKVSSLAPRQL